MICSPGKHDGSRQRLRWHQRGAAFRLVGLALVWWVTFLACHPAANAAEAGAKTGLDEFQLFINVKKDIILRCIYRPTDSDVIWGALEGLRPQLTPSLAGLLPTRPPNGNANEAWIAYKNALHTVSESPDCKLSLKSLVEKSIQGYCHSLDPYCGYDDAETWETAQKFKAREYMGVGITLLFGRTEGMICEPWSNGPADRAGIDSGDRLLAIGDHPAQGASTMSIHNWIYENGSNTVDIRVLHRDGKEQTVSIPMKSVHRMPVAVEQTEDGTRISIHNIDKIAADDFSAAMRSVGPRRAITLDLRGNGGGDVSEAVRIASIFLPANTPVCRIERMQGADNLVSTNPTPYVPSRLTILQDRFTASGAELLITALRDYAPLRAQSIGEKTYGKGVTVQTVKVSDTDNTGAGNIHAGVLTITVSRIYGPRDEVWDEKGLEPTR